MDVTRSTEIRVGIVSILSIALLIGGIMLGKGISLDPSLKQIIPYVVFLAKDQVFVYTRGKTQGESRLHALRSQHVSAALLFNKLARNLHCGQGKDQAVESYPRLRFNNEITPYGVGTTQLA